MNSPHPQLQVLRFLALPFVLTPIAFTAVCFFVVPETEWPPAWVVAVLWGLVAAGVALVLLLTKQLVSPAPDGASLDLARTQLQSLQIVSLAVLEAPVIVGLVLAFSGIAPSWVTVAIVAVPAMVALFALAFPHEPMLRRVQAQLDSAGTHTRFADRMLGRVD